MELTQLSAAAAAAAAAAAGTPKGEVPNIAGGVSDEAMAVSGQGRYGSATPSSSGPTVPVGPTGSISVEENLRRLRPRPLAGRTSISCK